MQIIKSRKFAVGVLVASILSSVFLLGGGALYSDSRDLKAVFRLGTQPELSIAHSMEAYLDRSAESALLLAKLGEEAFGASDPRVTAVREPIAAVADGEDYFARERAYRALNQAVENLYDALKTPAESVELKLAYDDFTGARNLIKNDPYRAQAADFNLKLSEFPAPVIGAVFGAKPFATFD